MFHIIYCKLIHFCLSVLCQLSAYLNICSYIIFLDSAHGSDVHCTLLLVNATKLCLLSLVANIIFKVDEITFKVSVITHSVAKFIFLVVVITFLVVKITF